MGWGETECQEPQLSGWAPRVPFIGGEGEGLQEEEWGHGLPPPPCLQARLVKGRGFYQLLWMEGGEMSLCSWGL